MSKLPIEIVQMPTEFEQILTDECNKYVAKAGYDIKFNNREFAEMLTLYLNKPYEFEELKVGMWVWDDLEKRYGKVTKRKYWKFGLLSLPGLCWGSFEPNRFYPREVKDNG